MGEEIEKAITILKDGGIVIYPTDTVYGIACRIDDEKAVKRLFSIKKRSGTQAVPVLVDSIATAQQYLLPIPEDVKQQLMEKYWPGGLTVVLPCDTMKVISLIRGEGSTLGVREPNHPAVLQLIHGLGVPITGTSANFHGEKTPTKFEELDKAFIKLVDFVLPGDCYGGKSSTVIDASVIPWKIVREGAVSLSSKPA
jgi:L-threonylcarbamoyladenylate synthase